MMSERREDPESGLLLYLRTSSMQEVQAGINEMRGLVQLRNQLVTHLRDQVEHFPTFVALSPDGAVRILLQQLSYHLTPRCWYSNSRQ